jgi:hypothetical protein
MLRQAAGYGLMIGGVGGSAAMGLRQLMQAHPGDPSRLLISGERVVATTQPNASGWWMRGAARHSPMQHKIEAAAYGALMLLFFVPAVTMIASGGGQPASSSH